jgi:arylsulfatase B
MLPFAAAALAVVAVAAAGAAKPPHIFFVMVDDLGSADVGFTRFGEPPHDPSTSPTVQTPHMNQLASEGVLLRRHYVHYVCTPTRSAVQTGRLPVHVQLGLANPASPAAGIPRNMTGLPDALRKGGAPYMAHLVGKWDAGMATVDHTPQGRGYNSSLHYFEHMNDYWTQRAVQTSCYNATDLWDTDRPAKPLRGTQFEEYIFRDRLLSIVREHDAAKPLLLFYTPHVAHMPLQVPAEYLDRFRPLTESGPGDEGLCGQFSFPCTPPNALVLDPATGCTGGENSSKPCHFACRAQYAASVALLDDVIGNVTAAIVGRGMWDDTLMIFSSDNGGPETLHSNAANNYPQRGGKFGSMEGGIRVAAFVSGGYLPRSARGTHCDGMISVADWYGTLARLAGDAHPVDDKAASAVPPLPAIDSLDVWALVTGVNKTSPRTVLPVDTATLLVGSHKLIFTTPAGKEETDPLFSFFPFKFNNDIGTRYYLLMHQFKTEKYRTAWWKLKNSKRMLSP